MTVAVHPAHLDVGIVGAGRVGAVLGAALRRAGHRITGVSAVSEASLERAATLLSGVPVKDVPAVIAETDLVLLAVPDDVLVGLVSGLAATGAWQAGQIVAHTSGRHGTSALNSVLAARSLPVAIHPAMTFTGTEVDLDRLVDCCFGVTAADSVRPIAEALVIDMGGEPVWVPESARAMYHAALTHGANHLVTLVAQAMQVLAGTGIENPDRVIGPLVRAALENTLGRGDRALTGPVSRGDVGTVALHLQQLRSQPPDVRTAYLAMARATTERAVASGRLSRLAAQPLLDLLAKET